MRALTSSAARIPEERAPSMYPIHSVAVSVPAQWIRPTGSRSAVSPGGELATCACALRSGVETHTFTEGREHAGGHHAHVTSEPTVERGRRGQIIIEHGAMRRGTTHPRDHGCSSIQSLMITCNSRCNHTKRKRKTREREKERNRGLSGTGMCVGVEWKWWMWRVACLG